ncbi:MAG TPA: hypothetical protein VL068_10715 [Microthrixaceae bacterium]|nr:hypothetical protein [Microthrixaceae bacterium]
MNSPRTMPFLAIALALVMGTGLLACSSDETAVKADNQASGNTDTDGSTSDDKGKNGRVFDSTNDAVVKALTTALDVKEVEFDGASVRLIMSKGSVEQVTASLPCSAAEAVLSKDENPILVYSDGEIDCSKRYDN